MATTIEYILGLKDEMSSKIGGATEKVKTMEDSLGGVKKIAESIGLVFGAYQIGSFLQSSFQEYRNVLEAQSQIQAGLKSTAGAAGMSEEQLNKNATALRQQTVFSLADIKDMQAQALSFNVITASNFKSISEATMDVATRVKLGLHETSIQMGKAFDDPIKGIMNLHREGIDFTKEQIDQIKKLQDAGKITQAQTLMLQAITLDYGGSAKAAFDADPLAKYNLGIEDAQDALGGLEASIMKEVMPAILELLSGLKELVDWVKKNGEAVWDIIKAFGIAYTAFKVISTAVTGYTALMEGLAPVEEAAAAAATDMAVASTAALGPIGLIAAAIGGLAYVYMELGNNAKIAADEVKKMASADASGETDMIKNLISYKTAGGMKDIAATNLVKSQEVTRLTAQISEQTKTVKDFYKNLSVVDKLLGDGQKKYDTQVNNLAALKSQLAAAQNYAPSLMPSETKGAKGLKGDGGADAKTPKTKAEGQKNINIHIAYNAPLIKDFTISTINMKEGLGSLKEKVTAILEGATHDSLIVASN